MNAYQNITSLLHIVYVTDFKTEINVDVLLQVEVLLHRFANNGLSIAPIVSEIIRLSPYWRFTGEIWRFAYRFTKDTNWKLTEEFWRCTCRFTRVFTGDLLEKTGDLLEKDWRNLEKD